MSFPYDTAVFDLDGTLVDSIPDIAAAFNELFGEEGLPTHSESDYVRWVGWGLSVTLELALGEHAKAVDKSSFLQRVTDLYAASPVERTRPYDGVSESLMLLTSEKVSVSVYTNKDETIARQVVEQLFGGIEFAAVVGSAPNRKPKPDPEALFERLRDEKIGTSSILYIGDSPVDVKTAINLGADIIGAAWGYRDESELREAGCMEICANPDELNRKLIQWKDAAHD